MSAQQHGRVVAEALGKCAAELGISDQHVGDAASIPNFKYWNRSAQERRHMNHRTQRHVRDGKWDDVLRMAMDDGHHVRPGPINLAMNEALRVTGARLSAHLVAVKIVFDDVLTRHSTGRNVAG